MITVCADAPEQNKERQKRRTPRVRRLCLRAVEELAAMLSCGGIFAKGEYIRPLRLESKLSDLRVGYANSILRFAQKASSRPRRNEKTQITARAICAFLVEVAGLELAASSTRNWRATNCATPRFLTPKHFNIFCSVCQYPYKIKFTGIVRKQSSPDMSGLL